MAVEWAGDNIQVNCIAPGFMMTPLTEGPVWGDEWRRQWLLERIPAHRPGKPEELAGAILLLASPASSYMTGHTVVVDGGYLIGGWWRRDEQ
jgi:NAD(P)-dependent dehydrogenase (short-subunit alcohol dehydrogenase family)